MKIIAIGAVTAGGKTTVVNAYSHVIIDMNEKKDLAEGENIGFDISVITNR